MRFFLFVAIPSEFPRDLCPAGVELIYTGVGKVNAAISATQTLMNQNPASTIVLNYGSAGSSSYPIHALVRCKRFQQADMDARPLVESKGHTPFDELLYPHLERDILIFGDDALCTTQDTFQQEPSFDVNDMEAYGIAKVCRILGMDFTAYKFISDSGDAHDWESNHHLGVESFLELLRSLLEFNDKSNGR